MWYSTPEIMDAYHQRMYANVKQASFPCRILLVLGNMFVFTGLELKKMSRTPGEHNGVSIFYEYT